MKLSLPEETFRLLKEYCDKYDLSTQKAAIKILTDALEGKETKNEEAYTRHLD